MGIVNKIAEKVREGGIPYTVKIIWNRLWENITIGIGKALFCLCKTENIIVIESHNDFDCNGGAFYDYLIKNGINQRWTIVWLVVNPVNKKLPQNVRTFDFWKNDLIKEYYLNKAKYLFYDDKSIKKRRKEQIEIYCQHGLSIKKVKGKINAPYYVDYILSGSSNYDPLLCNNISIPLPNDKMLHFGYPYNDVLFENVDDEFKKISIMKYSKKILWMPTFRKKEGVRNDSNKELPFGVPMIESQDELDKINEFLGERNYYLIIKIHPMQDKDSYRALHNMSNIEILDGKRVKELNIDNYRLMKSCDALLSDYSSAAYSFLLLNRPIGFVLADMDDYKLGFSVENFNDFLPGDKIYKLDDLFSFFQNLSTRTDAYEDSRIRLINYLYEYVDGKASDRISHYFGIV